jgi:hypothetical protein
MVYEPARLDLDKVLDGADLVLVHRDIPDPSSVQVVVYAIGNTDCVLVHSRRALL